MSIQPRKFLVAIPVGIALALSLGLILACGGGGSSAASSNPPPSSNPVPAITSTSPSFIQRGGTGIITLSVSGSNFIAASAVNWNGNARTTNFSSATLLTVQLGSNDFQSPGTFAVTVTNPAPGGGTSNSVIVTIQDPNPLPYLSSISPSTATAGDPGFTLQLHGGGFVASSVVSWNGSPRPTTYISSAQLNAQISSADIANVGQNPVTVTNPSPGGGTTAPQTFLVEGNTGSGASLHFIQQLASHMVWDPVHQVIYLSVPSVAGANGNSIAVLNPTTLQITSSQFAGSEPNLLALSDDASALYVSLDGASNVKRFNVPGLTPDIQLDLGADSFFGPFWAKDLQVAPGSSNTVAISLGANRGGSPEALGGLVVFDGTTPRPTKAPGFGGTGNLFDSIQWGANANTLFAANYESTGFNFYTFLVNTSGVSLVHDYSSVFTSFYSKIHYDRGTNLVYSDDGHIVDPATGHPVGTFSAQGLMVPDSSVNRAFFLGQTQSQFGSHNFTIVSFDLGHFTPIGAIIISAMNGNPRQLIRFGTNGLAINTDAGFVYLVNGAFISPTIFPESVFRSW